MVPMRYTIRSYWWQWCTTCKIIIMCVYVRLGGQILICICRKIQISPGHHQIFEYMHIFSKYYSNTFSKLLFKYLQSKHFFVLTLSPPPIGQQYNCQNYFEPTKMLFSYTPSCCSAAQRTDK